MSHDRVESQQGQAARKPSAAEWTTLALSSLIVLALVGAVLYLTVAGGNQPPELEATPAIADMRQVGNAYYLPIRVTNRGNQAAQEVLIRAEVRRDDGASETAEFTFDVLAGGETREATVVFSFDPTAHRLTVAAVSFQ